jgi:hypothetical protein
MTISELRQLRRERLLGSDRRAGTYSRNEGRRARYEFIGRTWWLFLIGMVGMAAPGVIADLLLVHDRLLRGLYIGALVTAIPLLVWTFVVDATGTSSYNMGDQAEQWTAQELRKARKRGWKVINHVPLDGQDVDHVLIGGSGVWVIETKWSSRDWRDAHHRARIKEAAERTKARARTLRLWQPMKALGIEPVPVVVLWGGRTNSWPIQDKQFHEGGVLVIAGGAMKAWLVNVTESPDVLDESAVSTLWHALDEHVQKRDAYEEAKRPAPTSPQRLLARASLLALGLMASAVFATAFLQAVRAA